MELLQERFEAWLFAQPKDRVIEAGSPDKCFLCSFVKETTDLKNAFFLGWFEWSPSGFYRYESLQLPTWALKLINHNYCSTVGKGNYCSITVAQMQDRYVTLFGPPHLKDLHIEVQDGTSVPVAQS